MWANTKERTSLLKNPRWHLSWLTSIPVIGPALSHQTGLAYVSILMVVVTWLLLKYTSFGLAVRAVGEDPRAADKAGINVSRTRYLGVLYAGALAGLGGAFMAWTSSAISSICRQRGSASLPASLRLTRRVVRCSKRAPSQVSRLVI